jgi:hypothetical protein
MMIPSHHGNGQRRASSKILMRFAHAAADRLHRLIDPEVIARDV